MEYRLVLVCASTYPKPIVRNICGVNLLMRKFQNQLLHAAQAWPRALVLRSYISLFSTQGVPFQEGV